MNKDEILAQLKNETYTRLATTEHGIGVVSIRQIPEGIDVFAGCMPCSDFVEIPQGEVELLDEPLKKLVIDFCPLQDGVYWAPSVGLKAIDQSYFLNHSNTPNTKTLDDGENFITARIIEAGEELTVDYNTYDEQPEDFK